MAEYKFRITSNARPFFNGRAIDEGEEVTVDKEMADLIKKHGWGESLDAKATTAKKAPAKKKRARTKSGHFIADDPSTPENEAYE